MVKHTCSHRYYDKNATLKHEGEWFCDEHCPLKGHTHKK